MKNNEYQFILDDFIKMFPDCNPYVDYESEHHHLYAYGKSTGIRCKSVDEAIRDLCHYTSIPDDAIKKDFIYHCYFNYIAVRWVNTQPENSLTDEFKQSKWWESDVVKKYVNDKISLLS